MSRLVYWLDAILFGPPQPFMTVLRAVDSLLVATDPAYAAARTERGRTGSRDVKPTDKEASRSTEAE